MLEAVGVREPAESVYRLLVASGRASAEELVRRTGMDPASVRHALDSLTGMGLVSHTDGELRVFRAVPPDVALLPRIKSGADALELARVEAARLIEAYQDTARRHHAGQLLEVITGAEALRQHLRQIQTSAREEMLWFCKAQYVAMPSGSNAEEYEALGRGVRYRVLYEKAFFDDEGAVDNVAAGVRAGEVATPPRIVP
ncbi:TrmB family transcriptional regulator [Streptomyces tendae]